MPNVRYEYKRAKNGRRGLNAIRDGKHFASLFFSEHTPDDKHFVIFVLPENWLVTFGTWEDAEFWFKPICEAKFLPRTVEENSEKEILRDPEFIEFQADVRAAFNRAALVQGLGNNAAPPPEY